MAAPRATQFIALRNLSKGSHQVRQLHMTGPATYAFPILTRSESPLQLPRDIAGLRAECKRRNIEVSGSKKDLLARLEADVLSHNRAFTTLAEQKRPTPSTNQASTTSTRSFNTSCSHKSPNDTSPIDFAYFPTHSIPTTTSETTIRVPILPTTTTPNPTPLETPEPIVMKLQINTMSLDSVYLPLAETTDSGAAVDESNHFFGDLTFVAAKVEEQAGLVSRIWSDMVDDVLGKGKKAAMA